MKTGEIASTLGVTNQTILDWIARKEFKPYFSPQALGESDNVHRVYNDSDVLVLNTICWMRHSQKVKDWDKIVEYLESGERRREYPENAISFDSRVIAVPHAEQSVKVHEALARLEEVNKLLEVYKEQISELKQERDKDRNKIEELTSIIAQLNREIGRLEGQVKQSNHS